MGKRTRSQRKGSSPRFKVSSHRFPGASKIPRVDGELAEVLEIIHSPIHTAPLAKIKTESGVETYIVATDGISIGSSVAIGSNVSVKPGNITILSDIPEGTAISNIEIRPGDGGKLVRSGGNSAVVEGKIGEKIRIRLPSGKSKDLPAACRATIGVLGGHGRSEKPLVKAGSAHYKAKARGKQYPTVSGVKMNPVDHPHGGGNHQAVHGPNSVGRNTPPGAKVGHIAPSRTGRGKGKKK